MKNIQTIILGATGLVGQKLVGLLVEDSRISHIQALSRRSLPALDSKVIVRKINFDQPEAWAQYIQGDVLFCAFGTTLKKAGTKERQYQIDFTYQYEVCKAATENGVKHLLLVSSLGADAQSHLFYSRIKGELEDAVQQLPFERIDILRPSVLDGKRQESRPGEGLAILVGRQLRHIPWLNKYAAIKDIEVARAMVVLAGKNDPGRFIHENKELFGIINEKK